MSSPKNSVAFGAPGIEPRWTSSAKEGVGTAYHTSCRVWFTLSHGIVNEIYYPHVDKPNTRDFQFLITDGETFCHEEKRDLKHEIGYPERDCLFYRLVNSEPDGRYRLVKHVLTDPHVSVLLVHTKLEVFDESLDGKLHVYALLAPHIAGCGMDNSGWCSEIGGQKLLHAQREDVHLVMACSTDFSRRSVGYVGFSDSWQDLMDNFRMDWEFQTAEHGNIALTGEIDLRDKNGFTIAVAFGRSYQSAATKLFHSLAESFTRHLQTYVRQWQRSVVNPEFDFSADTSDRGGEYRLSRCVLLAHEDKVFQGAIVASMSIPWGETKGDLDLGGYHLVWTRDLVQSASALLATGQLGTPLRALVWLAAIQRPDGSFPQNSWIDGTAYWSGLQLDQVALPILLAWRLHKHHALGLFKPRVMITRAAARLILQGPVTAQDRWEENAGYSPSTLAVVIAALACAAEWAKEFDQWDAVNFILAYSDWLAAHIEEWTVTTEGELVQGTPRHYIRITPTDPNAPDPHADPNTSMIQIANGGGLHPARNVVSGDFLHLVRYGIREAKDPLVRDSIDVIDRVLKYDLPQGPGWRRYNHDCYGQKDDGSAYDGTGVGRCWPILTGERGHYELAAGHDPKPLITTMEDFSNEGGMLTEQVWDGPDLPHLKSGCPTGAAMPLCWSHAEYISLVRSRHDGVCFHHVDPAYQRYVVNRVPNRYEFWTVRHALRRVPRGKILRIILAEEATLAWTTDAWMRTNESQTKHQEDLNLWFADFSTAEWPVGSTLAFTIYWIREQRWEQRNWQINIL
jgi:glucoamylase